MADIKPFKALRPAPALAEKVASPPYDVIKPGTPLESLLSAQRDSLFHIILGDQPAAATERLVSNGSLIEDDERAVVVGPLEEFRSLELVRCDWRRS